MAPHASLLQPKVIQKRMLPSNVSHVSICPRMDLIALALDHTSIAIYRTTWQRLGTISLPLSSPHCISALCWSPDASCLAVASSDATLAVYSVERASFILPKASRPTPNSASRLASVKLPVPASALQWSAVNIRPVYRDRGGELEPTEEEKVGGILFVGDHQGTVTAFMNQLQFLILRKSVLPEGHAVKTLHIVKDKSVCIVVGTKQGNQPEEEDCILGCIDLAHITEFLPEISTLGLQIVALKRFLSKLDEIQDVMAKEWVDGAAKLLEKEVMTPLQNATDAWEGTVDFGDVPGNPWETLHHVFCGARISGGSLQFLGVELGENGAREALRMFRRHSDYVMEHIQPIFVDTEKTLFRLEEYRAFARLRERFLPLGVHLDMVEGLFQTVEDFYIQLGILVWEIESASRETEAFLAWLVLAATSAADGRETGRGSLPENVSGEDALLVSKFFQSMINAGEQDAETPPIEKVSTLYETKLMKIAASIREKINALVGKPVASISPKVSLTTTVRLMLPRFKTTATKVSVSEITYDNLCYLPIVMFVTSEGHLTTFILDRSRGVWSVAELGLLEQKGFIIDASLYEHDSMVLLDRDSPIGDIPSDVRDQQDCRLICQRFNPMDYVYEIIQSSDDLQTFVEPSEVQTICSTKEMGRIDVDKLAANNKIFLSVDANRHIATVLASPRQVFLFKMSQST